ncbi:MAG: (Fe-S)-binding protein [Gammaproteobacteria bacterium]|nr:(Fe-S)-binding protein [Gammaproteobacteria bacterium]MDH4314151.1 (Fe-S)-binding protein [Gammaproteobacteria bacterium]MDH5212791.1 (Fe-S)-binding protein [Gammaproteobacteria bacterium]MDH5499981.1 (Fe-S)-binding protein [Gammaproteobacteria bacterium]
MNSNAENLRNFRSRLEAIGEGANGEDPMSDEERVRRAGNAFLREINGRMAVDLETCIHCGMCAEACHFYEATQDERYTPAHKFDPLRRFYRRELSPMRWLFRPFTRKVDAAELREWQELVYDACTGCGRCDMMCPMGINISELIVVMRKGIASAGLAPPEVQALQNEQLTGGSLFGVDAAKLRELVSQLKSQQIEVPLDQPKADILVLTTAVDVLVFTDALAALARIMNRSGASWTLSSKAFEAANVGLISGNTSAQALASGRIIDQAAAIGAKTVLIPESGHAYQALRWEGADSSGNELPFEVLAISEFVTRELDAGRLKFKAAANGRSVTYHDPCRLGRHGGVFEEPRRLLEAMGLENRDTESNRRENYCCGGGCGEYTISRAAPLRQKVFEIKRREFENTGADAVITACSNCRVNLMIGAENARWQKPIESLVETVAKNLTDA